MTAQLRCQLSLMRSAERSWSQHGAEQTAPHCSQSVSGSHGGGSGGRGETHLGLRGDQEVPGGDQQGAGGELQVLPVEAEESEQQTLPGVLPLGQRTVPGEVAGEPHGPRSEEEDPEKGLLL